MPALFPFRALRPAPAAAAHVAAVPYDVVTADEARALATDNPLSFLHVTRAEIDLPPDTPAYDDAVYRQAVRNFEDLKRAAPMVHEAEPSLYFYRLRLGGHEQTGVAGCFSVDEYERNLVRRHEKTRKDKEDDRTRHMLELRAQTGVVFLTHRAAPAIAAVAARVTSGAPLYDFAAPDGVRHSVWRVQGAGVETLVAAFASMPAVYIADGHHRAASAARARASLAESGGRTTDAARFIAVSFPDDEVRILPYNRTVRDLGGLTPAALLEKLRASGIGVAPGGPSPDRPSVVSMRLDGAWHALTLPAQAAGTPRADALDVEVLQRTVLGPLLGIGDPRTDKRIDFVGGIRGAAELERLASTGAAAAAFSMYPVRLEDLMAIADAGAIMPPKSTWFEPKLRDGLLVHLI